jgi:hypothetical protein
MQMHTFRARIGSSRALACALALALAPTSSAGNAQQPGSAPANATTAPQALARPPRPTQPAALAAGCAAATSDVCSSFADFDRVVLERYAMSQDGRAVLKHLISARMVEELAREKQLEISEAQVEERFAELDRKVRESGVAGGIAEEIRRNRLEPTFFKRMLRLSIAQERLAREALGLGPNRTATGEQQEMWIEQVIEARGLEAPPPPWEASVASCGPVVITPAEYAEALRRELPIDGLRETCYQLVLQERLERGLASARTPQAEIEVAIERELARREAEVAANPRYKGVSFAELTKAQGMDPARLDRDPAVRIAAMATLWIDRERGEDGLRAEYEARRAHYEGLFGEGVHLRLMYLSSGRFAQDPQLSGAQQARAELERIVRGVSSEEQFAEKAALANEDEALRKSRGELGVSARNDPRLSSELRSALWRELDAQPAGAPRVFGPIELPAGAAVAWIGAKRPSPDWAGGMRAHVHRELRRTLIEELLPPGTLRTFLDLQPGG